MGTKTGWQITERHFELELTRDEPAPSLRVAGYVRTLPREADSTSVDVQRTEIETHCEREGWSLVEMYVDADTAIWQSNAATRPAFQRMLADAGEDRFDIVIVQNTDRLTRHPVTMARTLRFLIEAGIAFISISEKFDGTDLALVTTMLDILEDHIELGEEGWGKAAYHRGSATLSPAL